MSASECEAKIKEGFNPVPDIQFLLIENMEVAKERLIRLDDSFAEGTVRTLGIFCETFDTLDSIDKEKSSKAV